MTLIKSPAAAPEGTFKRNSIERWQQRKEWIRRRMEPTTVTTTKEEKTRRRETYQRRQGTVGYYALLIGKIVQPGVGLPDSFFHL